MDPTRRRIAEEQRKKRIFNAKQRQIGLDVEGLNHQVHENHLSKIKEIEWEKDYAEELQRNNSLALLLEQQRLNEFKEHCRKIDAFRLSVQRPEYRRDFDLYDPNQKRKECPPTISDNDDCPISGIQRLEGEDLCYRDRLKKQKEQLRDLLLQQIQVKRIQNFKLNKAESDRDAAMLRQDRDALELQRKEWNCNKMAATAVHNENRLLAWQKQEHKLQWKISEEMKDRKDMEFNFHGDLLTENPLAAKSTLESHRILPDRWKGMGYKELKEYYDGQIQQIALNQRRKEQEQKKKALWDDNILCQQNTARFLDELERKHSHQLNKDLEQQNIALAQQQEQQQKFFNTVVNTNIPSKDYFNQFNTSSR